ncbi:MAG: glycosyltransferase family 2 protein [Candidatus Omnitrophica bacterium]|nr:glycosyltransferase family 2 protein [Candidatus Omnitrophota bacterium]
MKPAGRAALSVVFFVRNEEARIRKALESVSWADERVLIDDASTDGTARIGEELGATVVCCEYSGGKFYERRNFGFQKCKGPWVLLMDPDEIVSPDLRAGIEKVLTHPGEYLGFTFWRENYFLNQRLDHGGWRQKTLRLFHKDRGGDPTGLLHQGIEVNGPVGHIESAIAHYPFEPLSDFFTKQNLYTDCEALEMLERHRAQGQRFVLKQARRRPLKVFTKMAIKKGGWRDGARGWILAGIYGWIEFLRWVKCWELMQNEARS